MLTEEAKGSRGQDRCLASPAAFPKENGLPHCYAQERGMVVAKGLEGGRERAFPVVRRRDSSHHSSKQSPKTSGKCGSW